MEPLIDAVRKFPCLWNAATIEYRDQELKDHAWAEVLKHTDFSTVKEVKLRWKKLRDSYRDALKRQQSDAAAAAAGGPTGARRIEWKYSSAMAFLAPHMSTAAAPGARRRVDRASAASPPRSPAGASPSGSESPAPRRRRGDALETFFAGMCQATRALPRSEQLRVKRTLFEAVTRAEERALRSMWRPRSERDSSSPPAPP